eukprot:scaffold12211_cov116-Isochrysis_galbana.AAC.7
MRAFHLATAPFPERARAMTGPEVRWATAASCEAGGGGGAAHSARESWAAKLQPPSATAFLGSSTHSDVSADVPWDERAASPHGWLLPAVTRVLRTIVWSASALETPATAQDLVELPASRLPTMSTTTPSLSRAIEMAPRRHCILCSAPVGSAPARASDSYITNMPPAGATLPARDTASLYRHAEDDRRDDRGGPRRRGREWRRGGAQQVQKVGRPRLCEAGCQPIRHDESGASGRADNVIDRTGGVRREQPECGLHLGQLGEEKSGLARG